MGRRLPQRRLHHQVVRRSGPPADLPQDGDGRDRAHDGDPPERARRRRRLQPRHRGDEGGRGDPPRARVRDAAPRGGGAGRGRRGARRRGTVRYGPVATRRRAGVSPHRLNPRRAYGTVPPGRIVSRAAPAAPFAGASMRPSRSIVFFAATACIAIAAACGTSHGSFDVPPGTDSGVVASLDAGTGGQNLDGGPSYDGFGAILDASLPIDTGTSDTASPPPPPPPTGCAAGCGRGQICEDGGCVCPIY